MRIKIVVDYDIEIAMTGKGHLESEKKKAPTRKEFDKRPTPPRFGIWVYPNKPKPIHNIGVGR